MISNAKGIKFGCAEILRKVDLQPLNTLRTPAQVEYFCCAETLDQIQDAIRYTKEKQLTINVLGAGSNLFFTDDVRGLILQLGMSTVEVLEESAKDITIRVEGGKNWNTLVHQSLSKGWFGLENLALIPGSVGAAPVQNIGAYGVEQDQLCTAVEVIDLDSAQAELLRADECGFAYRDSYFKKQWRGRFIITAVHYRLSKNDTPNIAYAGIQEELQEQLPENGRRRGEGDTKPTSREVAAAVCAIRRKKLPDPDIIPNAGSFFKNPVIAASKASELLQHYPSMPSYDQADSSSKKIPAAWLIEKVGLKGTEQGPFAVHHTQALVLTNAGHGAGASLKLFAELIAETVFKEFGIELEQEVRVLP